MVTKKQAAALTLLHHDDAFVAVLKEGGVPCVPDASRDVSLLDLAERRVNGHLHVVHRLDRPVSGVVIFARTPDAAADLSRRLRVKTVRKIYWGVTEGHPRHDAGEVVQHLRKDTERNIVSSVSPGAPGSKKAETSWRVLMSFGDRSLLELQPHTGRSHQLRLAAAKLNCSLVGDVKYGASRYLKDKTIALHARELAFPHPVTGQRVHIVAPLPDVPLWNMGRRHLAAEEG